MSKIFFFEDQYDNIRFAIEWANRADFDNTLSVEYVLKTDAKFDFERVASSFDVVFVDIELAKRSFDDGIGVINKLIAASAAVRSRIVVISGHSEVNELLLEAGLKDIPVLAKPIPKESLVFEIRRVLNLSKEK
jgi:DNA-binding NtrC family response regulator